MIGVPDALVVPALTPKLNPHIETNKNKIKTRAPSRLLTKGRNLSSSTA